MKHDFLQGYDVVTMACPDRYVVGLDISKTVIEQSSKVWNSFSRFGKLDGHLIIVSCMRLALLIELC